MHQKILLSTFISLSLFQSCFFDKEELEHEEHLEPYGLLLVNQKDTLRFYNADAELKITEKSDTLRLKVGESKTFQVLLMNPKGVEVPDTNDKAFVLTTFQKADEKLAMKINSWNIEFSPNSALNTQFGLQILHNGHEDFKVAKPISVMVQ